MIVGPGEVTVVCVVPQPAGAITLPKRVPALNELGFGLGEGDLMRTGLGDRDCEDFS